MTERKMVPGLRHDYASCTDSAAFLASVDAQGGWPVGYKFAGFEHTESRAAGFTNSPHNDGWWTVVASADDYYLWKLSPAALQRVVDAAVESIRLPRPVAHKLWIKSSCGSGKAALAQPATPAATKDHP